VTCTSQTGAASSSGCRGYAEYLLRGALDIESTRRARYYTVDGPEHGVEMRTDLSPEFAAKLGIDQSRPIRMQEFAHLMNCRTASGEEIEGRKRHSAHQSVAGVFGLPDDRMPTADEIRNVLDGKRADGEAPRSEHGKHELLSEKRVASAVRAYKRAIGVSPGREATDAEIDRVAGARIDVADYRKRAGWTTPQTGYVDLTFSADKSVGNAYALAPTDAEREFIANSVSGAIDDAMAYAETVLGHARRGKDGIPERAEMAWAKVLHTTARPAVDIVRKDAEGNEFSVPMTVPTSKSDVLLHGHTIALSACMTKDGHVGSVPFGNLEVKTFGAVFHAGLATRLRAGGVDVALGPNGEARVTAIPEAYRDFTSRRTAQGEIAAQEWAAGQGIDWNTLAHQERAALISRGTAEERQPKDGIRRTGDEAAEDISTWKAEARAFGYEHQSVLQPDRIKPEMAHEQRIEMARTASLDLLEDAFAKSPVVPEPKIRELAARGLIVSGIGQDAGGDIAAVIDTYRTRGVRVDGEMTRLDRVVDLDENGRQRVVYTTAASVEQEERLAARVTELAADRSLALSPEQIHRAAERFLAGNPGIDREGPQWTAQREMAQQIGQGARLTLSIGVHGAGKTKAVIGVLTDAWHEQGAQVIGVTAPWKASGELKGAGADQTMALAALIHRYDAGKLTIDRRTVIVADEVSLIGMKDQVRLMEIVKQTGARLVEIGDTRQIAAVENPALDLVARAIGDESISKILTTIRQKDDRDKDVALMWRSGDAEGAIRALQQDGRFHLTAGGPEATVEQTVKVWRDLVDAGSQTPLVVTTTNQAARKIGMAVRADRQQRGEIGPDVTTVPAMDKNSGERFELPLAVGDKLRLFTRTWDADAPAKSRLLSSNGDVVEIAAVLPDGLRVRNEGGVEGRVTWSQMKPWRAPASDPIMATSGYALTAHTAQSLTRSDTIYAAPDGTAGVDGTRIYVGMSRHIGAAHLVVSESAERKAIVRKQMIGAGVAPTRADVMQHIGDNLSRFATPERATDVLSRAGKIERGTVAGQDRQQQFSPSLYQRMTLSPVVTRTMEMAKEAQQCLRDIWEAAREAGRRAMERDPVYQAQRAQEHERQRQHQHEYERGPSMGMGR